jgi:hypothetical protein
MGCLTMVVLVGALRWSCTFGCDQFSELCQQSLTQIGKQQAADNQRRYQQQEPQSQ